MESPGEYIRRERKLREISLQDVSEAIKVQAKLLKALEADDYEELPHSTFVKGFFRAYAKYLGLDDNDIVLRYEDYRKEFYDDIELESALPVTYPPATIAGRPREKSGEHRKKQSIAAAIIVVVVLGAIAYFIFSGPLEVATLSGDAESQAIAPHGDAGEGEGLGVQDKVSPEPVEAAKVSEADDGTVASLKPSVVKKDASRAVKPPVTKKAIKEEPLAKPTLVVATPESGHTLVAVANAATWMRVEIDGVKSKEVLLQPGESAKWSGEKGFSVLLGNAGGVTLTFDGVDMGSPGGVGKTVRVSFPEGVSLPPVVVKKKVVPEKAQEVSKEIIKPLEDAVKEAPIEEDVVKEDSIPSEVAETSETAEALPASNENAPAAPGVVKEEAENAPSPSETPVVNDAATDEEPFLITDEAGATPPVNGDVPKEVPEGTTELNQELPADAPASGVVDGEAADVPSVEEALPSEGADVSKEVPEAPSEEIDLMEDDF